MASTMLSPRSTLDSTGYDLVPLEMPPWQDEVCLYGYVLKNHDFCNPKDDHNFDLIFASLRRRAFAYAHLDSYPTIIFLAVWSPTTRRICSAANGDDKIPAPSELRAMEQEIALTGERPHWFLNDGRIFNEQNTVDDFIERELARRLPPPPSLLSVLGINRTFPWFSKEQLTPIPRVPDPKRIWLYGYKLLKASSSAGPLAMFGSSTLRKYFVYHRVLRPHTLVLYLAMYSPYTQRYLSISNGDDRIPWEHMLRALEKDLTLDEPPEWFEAEDWLDPFGGSVDGKLHVVLFCFH
ncbi:hypothetical protein MIND_01094300 [Mycena indigotica]|uniref:Uncharacterized protein n=1 Tax=Mycena indigotica TaxID=2126181 RepID=A0A8H6S9X3_9AGAR|nr:uncharacterized protein MIND_01094300 [Mycena indigotica]KAF7295543.1 hypothetical protein MIND_01094300 [Mycena indigotica]